MMRKSGAERLAIACRMNDSARELVWSGIPADLPEEQRRALFLQRFYGDALEAVPLMRTHRADSVAAAK